MQINYISRALPKNSPKLMSLLAILISHVKFLIASLGFHLNVQPSHAANFTKQTWPENDGKGP